MKSFWRDQRGNVALIFGIAVIPLVIGVGVAVDYSRAASVHDHLQEIADASALAGARENSDDLELVTQVARAYFDAHLPPKFLHELEKFDVSFTEDESVRVEVAGTVETTFTGVVGIEQMGVEVASEVVRGIKGTLEVAFVLDNTGSMEEKGKIDTLKKVSRKIVDEIAKFKDVEARYALVPFSNYVNVGVSRRYEPWLDVPADYSVPTENCDRELLSRTNCRYESYTYSKGDGRGTGQGTREVCDETWSESVCTPGEPRQVTWHGCVGSRPYPYNVSDDDYSVRVPGFLGTHCAAEIQPLTDDMGAIKSAIGKMNATGYTYIPAGLVWGWRMLSNATPFTEGKPYDKANMDPRKIIVLLTDGDNTLGKEEDGRHTEGADGPKSDEYVTEICGNVKDDNIEIFAIAFDVSDPGIKDVMQGCASNADHYFDAGSNKELEEAFEEIAASFLDLRISR